MKTVTKIVMFLMMLTMPVMANDIYVTQSVKRGLNEGRIKVRFPSACHKFLWEQGQKVHTGILGNPMSLVYRMELLYWTTDPDTYRTNKVSKS